MNECDRDLSPLRDWQESLSEKKHWEGIITIARLPSINSDLLKEGFSQSVNESAIMGTFKDNDSILYQLGDDHKRPNIIRGSGSKGARTLIGGTSPRTVPPVASSVRSASKVLKTLGGVEITSESDASAVHNMMLTSPVELSMQAGDETELSMEHSSSFQSEQTGLPEESMEISNSNVSFVLNEYGELQIVHGEQDKMDATMKIEDGSGQGSATDEEEPIVQATLQTDEGEFLIFVRGGEILSVQPNIPPQRSKEEVFEQSEVQQSYQSQDVSLDEYTEDLNSQMQGNEEVEHVTNEELLAEPPPALTAPSTATSGQEIREESQETICAANATAVIGETGGVSYVMVQLPNGSTILLPASALEGAMVGDGQIILDGNDQIVEVLNSAAGLSKERRPKSSSATRQRKRPLPAKQIKSDPLKSTVKPGTCVVTAGGDFLVSSHQMNAISNAIAKQRSGGICSKGQSEVPGKLAFGSIRNPFRNSRPTFNPQLLAEVEGKPRPFRFDMPETDDESTEFGGTNTFLPLVIENYQSSLSKQQKERYTIKEIVIIEVIEN
jgi:hypothetical protein